MSEQLEEIVEENTESTNKWIVDVNKLSDDEKREGFKELVRFAKSDEFKELKKFCDTKEKETTKEIDTEIKNRKETKATKSKLDLYVVLADTAEEVAKESKSDLLKSYLINSYAKALRSAVRYKVEEWFDFPSFSYADYLKNKASVYSALQHYLDTCIGYYDIDTKLMAEKKAKEAKEDNPNQPYE